MLLAHLRAGGDRFRGVRHIASWDADARLNNPDYPSPPALLMDRTFREGIAVLVRLGLSFDAMVYHPQLDDVADLAGAFPNLRIVLNHCGVPMRIGAYQGRHEEVFARWSASLRYQVFWNACKRLVSGTSSSDKTALFAGTAKRVYRLDTISLG